MRQWINLVEKAIKPASAQLIARITADTEENRKHIEKLERYEKEKRMKNSKALQFQVICNALQLSALKNGNSVACG